jgi:hypothetical protein
MKQLFIFLGLSLALLFLQNCVDPTSIIDGIQPDYDIGIRDNCSTINQDYIDDLRSLAAAELSVPPN